MKTEKHEAMVVTTGRRDADGKIRLEVFTSDLIALSVDAHGERAATLLLTYEQVANLQDALGNLARVLKREAETNAEHWTGTERRCNDGHHATRDETT
ncbi:MAG: hypothetical protein MSG64_11215 [Pyrinomonadaceae bacterium MAG19_C2-C3]|nr:hypothetical protein [Pyrinomonadaceae bacterium MAG19_C2-C3]